MNLLLLGPDDLPSPGEASVAADRYPPRAGLWPPQPGRVLRVGLRDGPIGSATVVSVEGGRVRLALGTLAQDPPPPAALALVLALPRPKMLRRALRSAAELGIKRIVLVNGSRVDRSYWSSPLLAPARIEESLRDGLEQCVDTRMPEVLLRPRLRPFVEDELPALAAGTAGLVAHPAADGPAPRETAPFTLAVGPEGGFTDFEIGLLGAAGLRPFSLGPRVLRVETALPALVATLLPRAGR
jgi:RsmE family RNA methyltransferase